MNYDFSFNKYKEIIMAITRSKYEVITIEDYIRNVNLPAKFIIIRHDVDLDPDYQLRFAEFEHLNNIRTSYYFRFIEKIYKKEVIGKVRKLGHSIGYHYEVFTKAKGDPVKAISLFREELAHFKENWDSRTVCPHGGSFVDNADGYSLKNMIKLIPKIVSGEKVFSSFSNFDIWDDHRFEEFGIAGDAYRSVDFTNILYLSDTGRSWDKRYKRLDKVNSVINPKFDIKSSDDIIRVINNHEVDKIYLLVHAEQWKDNLTDWLAWYAAQLIRRTGKKLIFSMK